MINFFKQTALSFLAVIIFWFFLEVTVRMVLYFATGSSAFLSYGFRDKGRDENRFEKVYDSDGNALYYRCTHSTPKNPINQLGLRGTAITPQKVSVKRIVCLGGSTTFGLSLKYADSYPKILQDKLNEYYGINFYEVINAGVPAHQLRHIINQTKSLITKLDPDIVILMSVFNNLVSDEKDFAFIAIESDEKDTIKKLLRHIIISAKKYSTLVMVTDDMVQKGRRNYLKNINWEKGAQAIMSSRNVWEEFAMNLETLIKILVDNNPNIIIFVLDEPMNLLDYPELSQPMLHAYNVQKNVCEKYSFVKHIQVASHFCEHQKRSKLWLAPYHDPIHLSRQGNELLAEILCKEIQAISKK